MSTGECFDNESMFFGGTVCVERDASNKETYIAYRVSSRRYSEVIIDLNKSKIIGEYIGSKSLQFIKGVAVGRERKSNHD